MRVNTAIKSDLVHSHSHRSGRSRGSCFPAAVGGRCIGTPHECLDCNKARTCQSDEDGSADPSPPHRLNGTITYLILLEICVTPSGPMQMYNVVLHWQHRIKSVHPIHCQPPGTQDGQSSTVRCASILVPSTEDAPFTMSDPQGEEYNDITNQPTSAGWPGVGR